MNKCALPKHLDRCRVKEHFRTNPRSLQESEDQLQSLFTPREVDDGNAQEEKDSSSWLLRWRDLAGLRGDWVAEASVKASRSARKTRFVGSHWRGLDTPRLDYRTPLWPACWRARALRL